MSPSSGVSRGTKESWSVRSAVQAEGHLGNPGTTADGGAGPGTALFNLGIDSKLRACDLTALRVRDICCSDLVASRATVLQRKTQRPVQFEITAPAREAVQAWIRQAELQSADFDMTWASPGTRR
jgi:hypothetical protein